VPLTIEYTQWMQDHCTYVFRV